MAKYFVWLHTRLDELPPIFLQALLEVSSDKVVEELCDQLVARAALRHTKSLSLVCQERAQWRQVGRGAPRLLCPSWLAVELKEEEWRVFIQTAVEDQRQSTWACDNFVGPRLG